MTALQLAFFLRRKPTGHVVRAYKQRLARLLSVAEALLDAGGREAAAAGAPLHDAVDAIWPSLEAAAAAGAGRRGAA